MYILNKCLAPFQQRLYTILQQPFSFSGSLNRLKEENVNGLCGGNPGRSEAYWMKGRERERERERESEVTKRSCRIVSGRTDTISPLNRQAAIYFVVPVAPS
jgi:hypothetical protein